MKLIFTKNLCKFVLQMSIQIKGEKMPKTATIQARIDPKIKEEAQKVFKKLNISLSEAISIFFTQVSLNKGIPFEIKIPNETTEETLQLNEATNFTQLKNPTKNSGRFIPRISPLSVRIMDLSRFIPLNC